MPAGRAARGVAAAEGARASSAASTSAEAVFRELDPDVEFEQLVRDGDVAQGAVARVSGNARALLTGERTALNLLGRLSRHRHAHASLRRRRRGHRRDDPRHAQDDAGPARAREARRARRRRHEPPLRPVRRGPDQGQPPAARRRHRVGRSRARRRTGLPVEVECETLDDVRDALDAGADTILLDNMTPVRAARGRCCSSPAARRPRPRAA